MKELLENLIKAVVDNPDQVKVHEAIGEYSVLLELKIAKEDVSNYVGSINEICESSTPNQAVLVLMQCAAEKLGKTLTLNLLLDEN